MNHFLCYLQRFRLEKNGKTMSARKENEQNKLAKHETMDFGLKLKEA